MLTQRPICVFVAALLLIALAAAPLAADHPHPHPHPARVVANVLDLDETQREAWAAIRTAAIEEIAPLAEEVAANEGALAELFDGEDPDPAAVGELVLAIRDLREQIHTIRVQARDDFDALLDDEQAAQLADIREIAPACRVVPAFAELHLL